MRIKRCNTGLTLVEMLVVVAIIAILVTIAISVASHLDVQSKTHLTQETFALLNTALSEFHDYGFTYSDARYADLKFPVDCNGLTITSQVESALTNAMGKTVTISGSSNNLKYFSTEAMYFLLSQVPPSKQTLEQINQLQRREQKLNILVPDGTATIQGENTSYPLFCINDAWGTPIGYKYYDDVQNPGSALMRNTIKTFPVLTSAGPDGIFDTADDIKSR